MRWLVAMVTLIGCGGNASAPDGGLPDATLDTAPDAVPPPPPDLLTHGCLGWGDGAQITTPLIGPGVVAAAADGSVAIAGIDPTGAHGGAVGVGSDGQLEPSFGNAGVLSDDVATAWRSITPRTTGGWYLAGTTGTANEAVGAAVTSVGQIDASTCRLAISTNLGAAVAAREVGDKIVIVIRSGQDTTVERRDAACALDPTYGNAGTVTLQFAIDPRVAVLADGGVVLTDGVHVTRLDPTGAPIWGASGVTLPIRGTLVSASVFDVAADGTITFVGTGQDTVGEGLRVYYRYMIRLTATGAVDPAFNDGGANEGNSEVSPQGIPAVAAVAVLADDSVVIAGQQHDSSTQYDVPWTQRWSATAALQWTSGARGIVGLFDAIAPLPDGRIVVTGRNKISGVFAVCYQGP